MSRPEIIILKLFECILFLTLNREGDFSHKDSNINSIDWYSLPVPTETANRSQTFNLQLLSVALTH